MGIFVVASFILGDSSKNYISSRNYCICSEYFKYVLCK